MSNGKQIGRSPEASIVVGSQREAQVLEIDGCWPGRCASAVCIGYLRHVGVCSSYLMRVLPRLQEGCRLLKTIRAAFVSCAALTGVQRTGQAASRFAQLG